MQKCLFYEFTNYMFIIFINNRINKVSRCYSFVIYNVFNFCGIFSQKLLLYYTYKYFIVNSYIIQNFYNLLSLSIII